MPRNRREPQADRNYSGEHAAILDQPITDTIETNFMPYAMSVIISRAIPEIDGFKPAHRKLLYTMYTMNLMKGQRTKSANIVGQTMRLNPHGDAAIYETLVRLTKGNETLLHPLVDSKGSFGKHYSTDMAYAASRYTEAKLDKLCEEIFGGIDRDAVDFVPNYDNTMQEPSLLPTSFPNILVNPNIGVAVGMTSSICSFNLAEICDGTIQLLKNPQTGTDRMLDIIRAPDFSGGGSLIYDRAEMKNLYETGRGSVRLRSRYTYDKKQNCIDILQIPYSTTIEAIIKSISQLVKDGKLKEISDFRDEIGLSGFKLTIDLHRGVDPDKLMTKLFKLTPLEDTFACNFNVLIDKTPQQLGVSGILLEWIRFRVGCLRRELTFELRKKEEKLHLLRGLGRILLDIDKAIKIIRETAREKDVVPNLMSGFDLDQVQAEFIAEIRLRNLNREYIINRVNEINALQEEIDDLKQTVGSELRLKNLIGRQLKEIRNKYGKPRQTQLIPAEEVEVYREENHTENYNCRLVLTREGYFKKITLLSLRGNDEQKLKEGDEILLMCDAENTDELIFFSDQAQAYKAKVADFDTTKAAALGDYVPARLGFDENERVLTMVCLKEYRENEQMVFLFENGKGVRVPVRAYETKGNRRKLSGAYSAASRPVGAFYETEPMDILMVSDAGRALIVSSSLIPVMSTRTSQGNAVFALKPKQKLLRAELYRDDGSVDGKRYRKSKIPAAGLPM